MVALLVLFTIVACLLADAVVTALRKKAVVAVGERKPVPTGNLVFAQDGGEKIQAEQERDRVIPWADVESEKGERE